jgi:hypothetical protein
MITAGDLKMSASVGVKACLYIFDPGAIHAQGYFVFALASSGAGVATDTLAIVDDEAVIHKFLLQNFLNSSPISVCQRTNILTQFEHAGFLLIGLR